MRMNLLTPLAIAAICGVASGQTVFTKWTFNNNPVGSIVNSPVPSTGHGSAVPLGMTNTYLFNTSPTQHVSFAACDIKVQGGSGDTGTNATNGWRVRGSYDGTFAHAGLGWSIFAPQYTQGAEFDVSTLNYSDVVLTFDWFTTNQGVRHMQVQYSINGGTTWSNIGPILVSGTNAYVNNNTVSFVGIADVNDNPNFRVRMVSVYDPNPSYTWTLGGPYTGASGGQYNNNSGNWVFDRVTFAGNPIRSVSPTCVGAVSPTSVCSGGGPLTFTVTVDSGVNPISTGMTVTADLSSLGLPSNQQFFDDGTHGDAFAGDSVYTFAATVPAGRSVGASSIHAVVADAQSRSGSTDIPYSVGDCSGNSASKIVISQTYGGGGHLGTIPFEDAPFDADFVELYNRSNQVVNIDGWSVQYSSPASSGGFDSAGDRVILSGNVQPGQHILIRMSDPVPGFTALPTPDFAQLFQFGGMGNTGGRVALVRSSNLLGTDFTRADVEDFVGYGTAAVTFEGSGSAPTPSPENSTCDIRKVSGAQDSNQNFNDFVIGTPVPHNRASGGFLAGFASSDAAAQCAGSDVKFTVRVVPGTGSTGITVHADVSQIVGSPSAITLLDNGLNGDLVAGDGIYSRNFTIPQSAAQGTRSVALTVTDAQSHSDTSSLSISVGNCGTSFAPVVISQVYGGGGNDFSGYDGDFAEIFNRSSAPVDLTGWSFQSARIADAGFDSRIVLLSGVINPGEYRLIITNQRSGTGATLPPEDFTPSPLFGMETGFGRVALVSTTNLLHSDYTRADVVDLVGYGTGVSSFEGVAPVPALSDIFVAVRKDAGCQDSNQNAIDFTVNLALAMPHNSSSPTHSCPVICVADFNNDTTVDFFDYLDFVDAFSANLPAADFNHDNVIDFFDYLDFVDAFSLGC